jgi:Flp pilus assembly protein TadB
MAGLRRTPEPPPAPQRKWVGLPGWVRSVTPRTRILILVGFGVGVLVAVLTGWLVAVLLVPAAVAGLPVLLSAPPAASKIERLEAMEEWTRSLSGVLTVGIGLEEALVATLRSAPDPIRPEVTRLVARLRARWSTEEALRMFADDLDDATGDLVAANLILAARRRGAGVASVLESLAESVAADVRARRAIEADRAKPRATARWVTLITIGVLAVLALTGSYITPLQHPARPDDLGAAARRLCRHLGVDAPHGHRETATAVHRINPPPAGGSGMTTGLQLALAGGALLGLGVALLLWRLAPAHPDVADALQRLSPEQTRRSVDPSSVEGDSRQRLGVWALKRLPAGAWARTPTRELALLRIPVARFYGEKVLYAVVGLCLPPLLTALFYLLDLRLPVVIPVLATVVLAAVMFWLPDVNVRDDAKKARAEFARALGAYIDLVALERHSGSGTRQAMEVAADVGDSWVFRRLGEELARSRWSGLPPWEALHALSTELGLPELADLADIMRLSGQEGAQVYSNLRARSAGMRAAMLNAELAKANEIGERMSIPMSILGVIFLAMLICPALLRLLGGT